MPLGPLVNPFVKNNILIYVFTPFIFDYTYNKYCIAEAVTVRLPICSMFFTFSRAFWPFSLLSFSDSSDLTLLPYWTKVKSHCEYTILSFNCNWGWLLLIIWWIDFHTLNSSQYIPVKSKGPMCQSRPASFWSYMDFSFALTCKIVHSLHVR